MLRWSGGSHTEALIHVFAWFPTGYGKFQFMFDFKLKRASSSSERSVVLVLSPLVWVSGLRKRGVSAALATKANKDVDIVHVSMHGHIA